MNAFKKFWRLLTIQHILAKNGLETLIVSIHLFSPLRFMIYLNPWNWLRKHPLSRGEALRMSLEQLGPLFVKFGQALSTRPDILPADIALELCKLQDKVPSFSSAEALKIIESAYGQSAFEVFARFDVNPLASASIAQVHAATLKSGEEVVVKILRPKIRRLIEKDLSLLKTVAHLADKYWKEARRFKPKEVVAEFERTLYEELNLQQEAANGAQLRRNFDHSPLLYIPEIHWDYVRKNILVLERISGIPITDIHRLRAHGVDIKKLAERGLVIFFTQVFRDCFFHADMHPGNIFVSLETPLEPQYICIDFGIIGTLNESDKRYLADNLMAFFNRDYQKVAKLHVECGWIPRDSNIAAFESAIRTVCEPMFEKPLKEISFATVILQLFFVARRFHMEVQPQLVLLQKTLFAVEGLGRQLYPELDVWATAKPFMQQWLREQIGPKAFFNNIRATIPFIVEKLPQMPQLLHDVLTQIKDNYQQKPPLKTNVRTKRRKYPWANGFGTGLLIAMLPLVGLSYWSHLPKPALATVALTLALVGGVTMLCTLFHKESSWD